MGDAIRAATLLEEAHSSLDSLETVLDEVARALGFDLFCILHPEGSGPPKTHSEGPSGLLEPFDTGEFAVLDWQGAKIGHHRNGLMLLNSLGAGGRHVLNGTLLQPRVTSSSTTHFVAWHLPIGEKSWNLAFVRGRDRGPVGAEEAQAAASVIPVANRALRMLHRQKQIHVKGVFHGLAAARSAAVLIEADGGATLATPPAERLFGLDFGIKDGRLWSAHSASDESLQELSDLVRRRQPLETKSAFRIYRFSDNRAVLARPRPLPGPMPDVFSSARMILFLTTPGNSDMVEENDLQALFGLSKAEAQIAAFLAHGLEPQQIAERRKVSVGTIRVQMKHIFQKVQVHRQAELIKIIAELRAPMEMPVMAE